MDGDNADRPGRAVVKRKPRKHPTKHEPDGSERNPSSDAVVVETVSVEGRPTSESQVGALVTATQPGRQNGSPIEPSGQASGQLNDGFWGAVSRGVRRFEKHPISKLVAILAAGYTLWVVSQTSEQIKEDLADRVQERMDNAIVKLQSPGAGDTGRGAAINRLVANGWDISRYDQSCKAVGVWAPDALPTGDSLLPNAPKCQNRVIIRDLFVAEPAMSSWETMKSKFRDFLAQVGVTEVQQHDRKVYSNLNFNDAELQKPVFISQNITRFSLNGALIVGGTMKWNVFTGSFANAEFVGTDLTGTSFSGSIANTKFENVELSGVNFQSVDAPNIHNFSGYSWSDVLPTLSEETPVGLDPLPPNRSLFEPNEPPETLGTFTPGVPLALKFLERMILCRPPSVDGKMQPLESRPEIRKTTCFKVTAAEALAALEEQRHDKIVRWLNSLSKRRKDHRSAEQNE